MTKTLTIFTPTFNRAYCLPLLYESLCRQTSADFKWLVIDDGSTDETKNLVQDWIDQRKIEIIYRYKTNGGMHTGHNVAFSMADTELTMCIDSDDYLPDDAVAKILTLWQRDGSNTYGGMIGLDTFASNGNVVGVPFPDGLKKSRYSDLKPKYDVWGDKKIVFRTAATKDIPPYPEFEGEKFVPLYMPLMVDRDFEFLCYNEVFCIVDYQADGSTINIYNQYLRNPKGFSYSRTMEMQYHTLFKSRFRSAIHYVMTSMVSRNWNFLAESPRKWLTFFATPGGLLAYAYLTFKKSKTRDISKYVKPNQDAKPT